MIPNINKVKGVFFIKDTQTRSKKTTRGTLKKYKKPDDFHKQVTKLPLWNDQLRKWGIV